MLKIYTSLSIVFSLVVNENLFSQQILVTPYIQPGNASTLSEEQKVLVWQTDSIPGNFVVNYSLQELSKADKFLTANISAVDLKLKGNPRLYRATLEDLLFDTLYYYDVRVNDKSVASNSFRTRTKKPFTKFAVMGDFGAGSNQQAAIAYRIVQQNPQFVLTTGDNVYADGLEEEYRKNFFPYYLPQVNGPAKGAALMNTIPFYMLLGNHDVRIDSITKKNPGSLAYFYYNDLPLNAPITTRTVPIHGDKKLVKAYKNNTKPRFPRMANFSFDYGNVHITCLDANYYANPLDPILVDWLKQDIGESKADWKIVAFHQPGFNSSKAHYEEQVMRLLSPLFENLKVNLVLSGHVHNYQRSLPLLFAPQKNKTGSHYVISPEGKVNGTFILDKDFDGSSNTKPKGIIYIVSGSGGDALYDVNLSGKPELWKHEPKENWEPFTQKFISNIYSFTLIETKAKELTLQQIDQAGRVIDQIKITQ